MKNRLISGLLMLATLTLAGSCAAKQEAQGKRSGAKSYSLMTIKKGDSFVTTPYSAVIRGVHNVEIRPQVAGVITSIKINEGAEIKRGETLFIIDQVPYKAALDVAEANVKRAKSVAATAAINAKSAEELYAEEVISNNEYQIALNTLLTAKADLALAQAQETSARNNLSYTVITSPVDGVASMIPYRIGALVNSSIAKPLVSVTNNNQMYAYFSLSEPQLLSMAENYGSIDDFIEHRSQLDFIMSNGSDYKYKGELDAISGTIDRETGQSR